MNHLVDTRSRSRPSESQNLTRNSRTIGTPQYMAPEQALNNSADESVHRRLGRWSHLIPTHDRKLAVSR